MAINFNDRVKTPCGAGIAKEFVSVNAVRQIDNRPDAVDVQRWRVVVHRASAFSPDPTAPYVVVVNGRDQKICAYDPEVVTK